MIIITKHMMICLLKRDASYDHPDSFESERMAEDVRKLLKGYPIEMPTYDYVNHNRAKATITVEPKPVIIMEGILILENRELRDLMDIKIYVDTDADEWQYTWLCEH